MSFAKTTPLVASPPPSAPPGVAAPTPFAATPGQRPPRRRGWLWPAVAALLLLPLLAAGAWLAFGQRKAPPRPDAVIGDPRPPAKVPTPPPEVPPREVTPPPIEPEPPEETAEPTGQPPPDREPEQPAAATDIRSEVLSSQRCYERRLRAVPGLRGRVAVSLQVGADGRAENVRITDNTTGDDELGRCITGVFERGEYDAHDPPALVSRAFNFQPPREEEPEPQQPPTQEPVVNARECFMRGDHQCVIRLLRGRAGTAPQMIMLIESYRASGQTELARQQMRLFVQRFPNNPRTPGYRQQLGMRETPVRDRIRQQRPRDYPNNPY